MADDRRAETEAPEGPREGSDEESTPQSAPETEPGQDGEEAEVDPTTALEAERDEYLDLAQRARAELENYRKRMAGEIAAGERRGREAVAKEVLPAIDNLERALAAAGADDAAANGGEADGFSRGVSLVVQDLRSGLTRAGIAELDPTGEPFDPNRHEAVAKQPSESAASGTVIETLQRGYLLGDHAIRPARVIVAE